MASPINMLLDKAKFTCTVCKAPVGTCDCWQKCPDCNWSYLKGTKCRNCHEVTEKEWQAAYRKIKRSAHPKAPTNGRTE